MAKDTHSLLVERIEAVERICNAFGFADACDGHRGEAMGTRDPDDVHTLAKARLANAEAERVELEVQARRQAAGQRPDGAFVALKSSVEAIKTADGAPAFVLRLHGDVRMAQVELSPQLAASLTATLGLLIADVLAAPRAAR